MTETKKDTSGLKNFINGEWVSAGRSQTLDVPNPATNELLTALTNKNGSASFWCQAPE